MSIDYEKEVYPPEIWDALPDCKVYLIPGGDDGIGESPWGKMLPDGRVGLNNHPFGSRYRWQDIVKVEPHNGWRNAARGVEDIVHRRWVEDLWFHHSSLTHEEHGDLRRKLWEAFQELGMDLSFWNDTTAHVMAKVEYDKAVLLLEKTLTDLGFTFEGVSPDGIWTHG